MTPTHEVCLEVGVRFFSRPPSGSLPRGFFLVSTNRVSLLVMGLVIANSVLIRSRANHRGNRKLEREIDGSTVAWR
jgi:hypothetical protein